MTVAPKTLRRMLLAAGVVRGVFDVGPSMSQGMRHNGTLSGAR